MSDTPLSQADLSKLRQFVASRQPSRSKETDSWAQRCYRLLAELESLQSRIGALEAASDEDASSHRRGSDTTIF